MQKWEVIRWLNLFRRSTFARDVLKLFGATGAAQIVGIAAYPLLTRLYDPAMFGLFGSIMAALNTVAPLATLRFEACLPIARGVRARSGLLVLCFSIPIVVAILLGTFAKMLRPLTEPYLGEWSGQAIVLAAMACMMTTCWNTAAVTWCIRQREFGRLAVSRFASGISTMAMQFIFAWLDPSVYGLLYGFAAGQLIAAVIGAASAASFLRPQWRRAVTPRVLMAVAKRFGKFPLVTAPFQVINALGANLPQMGVVALYGLEVGGLFTLAQRICGQPSTLIGQGVGNVFWARAADLVWTDVHRLRREYIHLTVGMAVVTLPGFALFFIGEPLFAWVFGREWQLAGYYAALLFIGDYIGIAATSTDNLLTFGRNSWAAAWELGRLMAQLTALALAYFFDLSAGTAVLAISVARLLSYIILINLNYLAIQALKRQRTGAAARSFKTSANVPAESAK